MSILSGIIWIALNGLRGIGKMGFQWHKTNMETIRVDIIYRPLRIAFAVHSTDREGLRAAIRRCHCLWGGQFNPIILIDRPGAHQLIELFRPDIITPLGTHDDLVPFKERYAFLENIGVPSTLFYPPYGGREGTAAVLDVRNLLAYQRDKSDWKAVVEHGIRVATWDSADPLADVFLMQFGQYPTEDEVGIDYSRSLSQATGAFDIPIAPNDILPTELGQHPGISYLSRYGLNPHHSSRGTWDFPGFYLGSAANIDDLVTFWNLRACGIRVAWCDLEHQARLELVNTEYDATLRTRLAALDDLHAQPAAWVRYENLERASVLFGGGRFTLCPVSENSWNGLSITPAKMHFGTESALAVVGGSDQSPRLSFPLKDKPFSADPWFFRQQLMASISLLGNRGDGSNYTFIPPCVPELNEFAGRVMLSRHDDLRLEPDHIGIIIDTADVDLRLTAMPVSALIKRIFALAGFEAKPSGSGLITRQLVTSMGGIDKVRAFKIPGVRKLIKSFGPTHSFSKRDAINKISSRDADTGSAFSDHRQLYIEPREGGDLTPPLVFTHLVEKGLFRIGADLRCPTCHLSSWTPLDNLRQQASCPLCGGSFDATRQLVEERFAYRRNGVLGVEKNAAGSIPVAMVLQQLYVNLQSAFQTDVYAASYDLKPLDTASSLPTCETDFVVLTHEPRLSKPTIIIGECKDAGGMIDANDVDHLRAVADAFPEDRFAVYLLLAKLSAFTAAEIELAKSLNTKVSHRTILLCHTELESYHIYERHSNLRDKYVSSVSEMAEATFQIYFSNINKNHS
ncbi:hypothetical protein [Rhizobium rhizoryzae]|uniref:hypothetical protein n=1 Tax=Rhizobium rhizoryzae TaxID=451876 RepID=UPI0028A94BD8|nr:hypothetical protein [Rhizobium rhizoryzae]